MEIPHDRLVAEALEAYNECWSTLRQSAEPLWTQLDLTITQLKVLLLLDARGIMTISQLSALLSIARPSGSILVEQLVQLQLVERGEDPTDRRRTLLKLLPLARNLVASLYAGDRDFTKHWFEQLASDDLIALARGLHALAAVQCPSRAAESA
jgi:DNA-binding MarR family transcriptional regulator